MSRRLQLVHAAAQLHTAVVDARAIASQREAGSAPIHAADTDAVARPGKSEPPAEQAPPRRARMSLCRPTEPDLRFDPSVPRPARVYAYWLGGKDHYSADRVAAEQVITHHPQVVAGARANRVFMARVVRYLAAECSIRQFLDIGTGMPALDNTHEVAQVIAPDCRIVYVDNDPLVLVHARALLTSTRQGSCDYLEADLRDPSGILAGAARTLDLTRPVAVLLLAVLHFIADADDPTEIVAALASRLAPGSYLVISHLTADFSPDQVTAGVQAYNALVPTSLITRSHAQVSALFAGLPLVAPGVVPLTEWRPAPIGASPQHVDMYAGVARTQKAGYKPVPAGYDQAFRTAQTRLQR
jgi:SAM-dependent methyltransferase